MAFVKFLKKLQIFNKICSIYLTRRIVYEPLGGLGRDLGPWRVSKGSKGGSETIRGGLGNTH